MELFDAERSHAREDLHYLTVSEREASEYESAIFCWSLRYGLTGLCAIVVDGCSHRSRMAEACCVRVDETAEVCGVAESDELRNSFRCILELLAALLEYPETADVLEESCGTLDSTLVGEILTEAFVSDDGVRSLDAEKRPGAAAEISVLLVFCRNGCYGRTGVVSGNRNNVDCREACELLYLWGKLAYDSTRLCELSKFLSWKSECPEYVFVKVSCDRVEHL